MLPVAPSSKSHPAEKMGGALEQKKVTGIGTARSGVRTNLEIILLWSASGGNTCLFRPAKHNGLVAQHVTESPRLHNQVVKGACCQVVGVEPNPRVTLPHTHTIHLTGV
jgi:hypothetical protein